MIEKRFSLRFNQREMLSFKKVGDLIRCIENKLGQRRFRTRG